MLGVMTNIGALTGLSPLAMALVVLVVLVAAFMRGLTGFGFAIAAVPLLSVVADPRLAIGISMVLPVPSGLIELPKAWPASYRPAMPRLILGALLGTPPGMLLLKVLPADLARIGVALAAFLALMAVWRLRDAAKLGVFGRPTSAGVVAGLLNGLAGMPGPPIVSYFLTLPITPFASRASMIVLFLFTGLIGTASGLVTGIVNTRSLVISLVCLGPFVLGNWAGRRLFDAADARIYRAAALTLLLVGAITATWKGLAGLI